MTGGAGRGLGLGGGWSGWRCGTLRRHKVLQELSPTEAEAQVSRLGAAGGAWARVGVQLGDFFFFNTYTS